MCLVEFDCEVEIGLSQPSVFFDESSSDYFFTSPSFLL